MGKKKKSKKKDNKKNGKKHNDAVNVLVGDAKCEPLAFGVAPFVRIIVPVAGSSVPRTFPTSGSSRMVSKLEAALFADSAFATLVSNVQTMAAAALFSFGPFQAAMNETLSGTDRCLRVRGLDANNVELARDFITIDVQ